MADINRCIFTGRLGADPELRTTASGITTCAFSLAVNRPKAKGAEKAETDWLHFVAWRETAEFITRYLSRGRKVTVEAEARTRKWTGKDGKNHEVTEFQVTEIIPADNKPAAAQTPFAPADAYAALARADFNPAEYYDGELPY